MVRVAGQLHPARFCCQRLMVCAAAEVSAAYDAKLKQLLPAAVGLTLQAAREWGFRSASCDKRAVAVHVLAVVVMVVVVEAAVEDDAVIVSDATSFPAHVCAARRQLLP